MSVTKVTSMMSTSTKGGDIPSASTLVIDTDGDFFDITGTTGITAMTVDAGRRFTLQFDGAVTLTHGSSLYLTGATNFTTEANDNLEFIATAANTVRCTGYALKDGGSVVAGGLSSAVIGATYDLSTASGTQDITGFGFQPTAVHALMFINVTDDWCHSFTNFTASRGMHAASTTTAVVYGTAAFAVITTSADSVRQTANPVAAIADGIRITWTKQNSPTGTIQQYFIGYK